MSSAVIGSTRNHADRAPMVPVIDLSRVDDRPMMTRPTQGQELARLVREQLGARRLAGGLAVVSGALLVTVAVALAVVLGLGG